ncbi:MAG: RNA polymerase sigma factor [Reichenbachiella sp.]|uniref:RNA polymerase sigma factor n=1 Tax=Reichenbachiella sp. TaxID=2184521 RepID=UPI003264580F
MNEKSQILDGLLVLQAQRGNRKAFEQLVHKWHKKLIYQSYIRTKDWKSSEDIVQDVWQWLISNLRNLKESDKFGAWIRTIVDRRSIDWVRKQERVRSKECRTPTDDGFESAINTQGDLEPMDEVDTKEQRLNDLEKAINKLNADFKLVLMLYYSESNSIETIAQVLAIPKGTVKSRLYKAREKLKNILNENSYEKSK